MAKVQIPTKNDTCWSRIIKETSDYGVNTPLIQMMITYCRGLYQRNRQKHEAVALEYAISTAYDFFINNPNFPEEDLKKVFGI